MFRSAKQSRAAVSSRSTLTKGFTLVELLVVIGIIALLISILLPALTRARRSAQRTACAAKLHQMMLAADLHRAEHSGYYPLAGYLPDCIPGPTINDIYANHYIYISYIGNVRQLAAVTDSLAYEMGYKDQVLARTNTQAVSDMMDSTYFVRNFLCPSQASSIIDVAGSASAPGALFMQYTSQAPSGSGGFSEPQSYIFNEAVLGYNDALGRYRGQASRVRQPSLTMFAADGLHGALSKEVSGYGTYTLYNNTAVAPVTMGEALVGNSRIAEDPTCFDTIRHQGKINVAFCDSHVETRNITFNDLSSIFLLPP